MEQTYKDIDFKLAIIPHIAELITQEGVADNVRELRWDALMQLTRQLNYYKSLGYIDRLLYAIAEKKGKMIMETSSKTEMEKVLKPHAPHYNGNEFFPDKYNVLEEELICWSETSLKSPLNEAGNKRYMQLFSEVFPDDYVRLQKMMR